VDGILVSQGFRDLVDDARGVLLELLCEHHKSIAEDLQTHRSTFHRDSTIHGIMQLTGAICPEDEIYRPGLWIVLRYNHVPQNQALSPALLERVKHLAEIRQAHGSGLTLRCRRSHYRTRAILTFRRFPHTLWYCFD